jgi:hypothetical protein
MGQVDRIQPVTPAMIQSQASSGVAMRKDGRQQSNERDHRDKLELHDSEVPQEEALSEEPEVVELYPEHGLDLTA